MISLPSAWVAAYAQSEPEPVVILEIEIDATTDLRASSGLAIDALGAPTSIASVSVVASKLDPLTRRPSASRVTVEMLADGLAKGWVTTYRLKGKRAYLRIGERNIAESSYVETAWLVTGVRPHRDGSVTIELGDPFAFLAGVELRGAWWGEHPLAIALELFQQAPVPASMINEASFDHTTYTDISHWLVRNFDPDNGVMSNAAEPPGLRKALDVIGSLAELLPGTILAREEGELLYLPYDPDGAVVATWTDDEITKGTLEIEALDENVINRVAVELDGNSLKFVANDTGSQAALAAYGESIHVASHEARSEWVRVCGLLDAAMTVASPGVSATFDLRGYGTMCGLGTADANEALSTTRTAFIQLGREVIEVDQATPDQTIISAPYVDPRTGDTVTSQYSGATTLRVKTRPALGTTAAIHTGPGAVPAGENSHDYIAYDVTLVAAMAQRLLTRFAYGAPVVTLETTMAQFAVQLGDLVQLVTTQGCMYGHESLTTALTWEVTGKNPDYLGGRIEWELTLAKDTGGAAPSLGYLVLPWRPKYSSITDMLGTEAKAVVERKSTGLALAATSGFNCSVAAGAVDVGGRRTYRPAVAAMTFVASKDTYVYWDSLVGTLATTAVANGAAAPSVAQHHSLISKVVTDGAGVTNVTNYSLTKAFADSTVQTDTLATLAVTTPKIAASAVNSMHLTTEALVAAVNPNTSFEIQSDANAPPDAWDMDTGTWDTHAFLVASTPLGGSKCLKLGNPGSTGVSMITDYLDVVAGEEYLATGSVRADVSALVEADLLAYCEVTWYDAALSYIDVGALPESQGVFLQASPQLTGYDWYTYSKIIRAPSNARYALVGVANADLIGSYDCKYCYFDKIELRRVHSIASPFGPLRKVG